MKVLATKQLTPTQKGLLKGFELIEKPMISISYGTGLVLNEKIKHAVFTSSNSVTSVFLHNKISAAQFHQVYCVGKKTKLTLENYGIQVVEVGNDAEELASILTAKFKEIQEISWFCGNLRNSHFSELIAENGVLVTEYEVYKTNLSPQKVEENLNAILFFSPSGIQSYIQANKVKNIPVFCIGVTTATEALNYFDEVYISEETSVESVIEKVKEII